MKRVLIVDDEPQDLESLKQILAPLQAQWETAFAPDSEAALTLLSATPFDALVSTVRDRGLDGASLLNTVCEKFPTVVRIALASQEELDAAMRTIPVAHQFLAKPCDPTMLRVAVERATSLSDVLNNKMLASIVGSIKDLPIMPRTYLSLRERMADPEVSVKDVVVLVEKDVGISAKILQLVNSALFGLPREISTVKTAVSFLGIDMVHNLVLSAEVFRVFEKTVPLPGFSFEDLQTHSHLTAKIAGGIPASAVIHSAAIVAALLHDVGKLVMATRASQHFARALEEAGENRPLFVAEEQLMGVTHAEVGAYLLSLWGLPCPVVEAVAHHHQPHRVPQDSLDAVGIVHIANFLAHEHAMRPASAKGSAYQPLDEAYVESLDVKEQIAAWNEMAEAAANEIRDSGGALSARTTSLRRGS
ncbi:MAG TPA: response regulator [Candidatus Limnocylindrales bacterium]|nr:response regulator [Candidatus Limnocylindrales bacterium]